MQRVFDMSLMYPSRGSIDQIRIFAYFNIATSRLYLVPYLSINGYNYQFAGINKFGSIEYLYKRYSTSACVYFHASRSDNPWDNLCIPLILTVGSAAYKRIWACSNTSERVAQAVVHHECASQLIIRTIIRKHKGSREIKIEAFKQKTPNFTDEFISALPVHFFNDVRAQTAGCVIIYLSINELLILYAASCCRVKLACHERYTRSSGYLSIYRESMNADVLLACKSSWHSFLALSLSLYYHSGYVIIE